MQLFADILTYGVIVLAGLFGVFVLLTLFVDIWRDRRDARKVKLLKKGGGVIQGRWREPMVPEPESKCPYCHKTESEDKPHTKCTEKAATSAKKQLLKTLKELHRSND